MTYDEKLATRVRRVLPPTDKIVEKHMFGGIAFLLDGKMFCGVVNRDLLVRVGPEAYQGALARPTLDRWTSRVGRSPDSSLSDPLARAPTPPLPHGFDRPANSSRR